MKKKDLVLFRNKINNNKKISLFELILFNTYFEYEENKKMNFIKFYNSINAFNNILEKCVLLSSKLNLNNSLDIVNFYTLLLHNGYFSVNGSYNFKDYSKLLNLSALYEFDIILGQGNCLSNSTFISKLLNKHGIKSFPIHNLIKSSKTEFYNRKINELEEVKNYIIYDDNNKIYRFIRNYINKKLGNHVNVLIDENNQYIFDPTNIALYRMINKEKASLVTGIGAIDLKLLSSYIFINSDFEKNFLIDFINNPKFSFYNSIDFRKSYTKILEILKNNQDIILEFRDAITEDLNIIFNDVMNNCKINKKQNNFFLQNF